MIAGQEKTGHNIFQVQMSTELWASLQVIQGYVYSTNIFHHSHSEILVTHCLVLYVLLQLMKIYWLGKDE